MHTYIPISPPSCASLPTSLTHPFRWSQNTELISMCSAAASHQLFIQHLVVYICQCYFLTSSQLPLPRPLSPQVHSLRLRLYSCAATRFIKTFFFSFLKNAYRRYSSLFHGIMTNFSCSLFPQAEHSMTILSLHFALCFLNASLQLSFQS